MFRPSDCAPNAPAAFLEYSEILRRNMQPAKNPTLVDRLRPGGMNGREGAFTGKVGVFLAPSAIIAPLGQWSPNYMGSVPVSAQQQIVAPNPWETGDDFNG